MQDDDPALDHAPAPHAMHTPFDVAPLFVEYDPAKHPVHVEAPVVDHVPATQETQTELDVAIAT